MHLLVLKHGVHVWVVGGSKRASINSTNEWVVTTGHHSVIRGCHGALLSRVGMHHHVRRHRSLLLLPLRVEGDCLGVRCMKDRLWLLILLLR